jgi:dTDP-4-amino-4,6-dideoxygalactose transaminase
MNQHIAFNKPYLTGNEVNYILQAVQSGKISGDGLFTKKCHQFFESRYGFQKCLLTTSCTDALELASLLLSIQPGDEVIAPSFTFVSTVNAFVLRGAKIIFADSEATTPNMDVAQVEALITPKTKAIVPVHYAGVAVDMDPLMELGRKYQIPIVEDAAQAIDAWYKDKALGGIGQLAAFSFHETKNIISGEGGMLSINDSQYIARAEILREKGTNRSAFFRGEIDKYGWVDIGSSFLPSEIIAAFLYAQIEKLEEIQSFRLSLWQKYKEGLVQLEEAGKIQLPFIPEYARHNAHMFYILCSNLSERTALIEHLKKQNINAVFHYISLHKSPFYADKYLGPELPQSDRYTDTLLRLPFYNSLSSEDQQRVLESIYTFYQG